MRILLILSLSLIMISCNSDKKGPSGNTPKNISGGGALTQTPQDGGGVGNGGGGTELTTPEETPSEMPTEMSSREKEAPSISDSHLQFYSVAGTNTSEATLSPELFNSEIEDIWMDAQDISPNDIPYNSEFLLFSSQHTLNPDVTLFLYLSKETSMGVREASIISVKRPSSSNISSKEYDRMMSQRKPFTIETKDDELGLEAYFFDYDVTVYMGYNESTSSTISDTKKIITKNELRALKGIGLILKRSLQNSMDEDSELVQYYAIFPFSNQMN